MDYEIVSGCYDTLGVARRGGVTTFTLENREQKPCALLLYPKEGGEPERIPMKAGKTAVGLSSVGLKNFRRERYDYRFELGGLPVLDPWAARIVGREQWGDITRKEAELKCGFWEEEKFLWGDDCLPRLPKEDMVLYKLHVRGFSMLQKAGEEERGTLRGIERKLAYLKELGITTLELMPIYEFEELFAQDPFQRERLPADKINYWGYTGGNYFAPKSAYLGPGRTPRAWKRLIHRMHGLGMECILEFYFPGEVSPFYAVEALRHWAGEYHVDGFHLIGSPELAKLVAEDPYLSGRKLFYDWFSEEQCEPGRHAMELFSYNDAFLYSVRKVMNRQDGSLAEFAANMRRQQRNQGFVNYLASNNGFTLYDVFSYTEKRNQANGEENRDGISFNFSSNCGQEGESKRRQVLKLRERQVKNALCALLFAQGTPLLWMGDECGNSQKGNNNAYCQDNETGWKSWDNSRQSRELTEFLRQLTRLRRRYPQLRSPKPMEFRDVLGSGYPDLSYHGTHGWQMEEAGGARVIGMMYAGLQEDQKGEYLYVGYNFSAADQNLALPALPKGYVWRRVLDTGQEQAFLEDALAETGRTFLQQAQSVCLLEGSWEGKA